MNKESAEQVAALLTIAATQNTKPVDYSVEQVSRISHSDALAKGIVHIYEEVFQLLLKSKAVP